MGSAGSPDIGVHRSMYTYICTTVVPKNGNKEKLRIHVVKGSNCDVWKRGRLRTVCGGVQDMKTILNEALLMYVLQITLL